MLSDFRGEVWINVHSEILKAMEEINDEPLDGGYGDDVYAKRATALMQANFDEEIFTTFAINGTAANVMALKAMLDRFSAVLCAKQTHVNTYEAGALEFNLGNKILTVDSPDGKLTPALLDELLCGVQNYKYVPKVVSLAQPTEYGTLYTRAELKTVCDYAHDKGMYVYLDGARLPNAIAAQKTDLRHMIGETGVDAFSFGGTKAGAMFGEMVIFRRAEFARCLKYSQKQSMQHMSKSKFLSVQIWKILERELWLKNAELSNAAALLLEARLKERGIKTAYKVESNMVFAVIDRETFERITKVYDLHYWDEKREVVRLAATYLTTESQINQFVTMF